MFTRSYSEDAGNEHDKTITNSSNTASNFMWIAGTGGFFGALIYFLGKPEEGSTTEEEVSQKLN